MIDFVQLKKVAQEAQESQVPFTINSTQILELLAIQAQLVEALSAICNMQQRNFGDGIATHIALISLSDDGRTALAAAGAQP